MPISIEHKKVTIVHKAECPGAAGPALFLECGDSIAEETRRRRIEVDDRIVDACTIQTSQWFNGRAIFIVTTDLFAQTLPDELAGLVQELWHGTKHQYPYRHLDLRVRSSLRSRCSRQRPFIWPTRSPCCSQRAPHVFKTFVDHANFPLYRSARTMLTCSDADGEPLTQDLGGQSFDRRVPRGGVGRFGLVGELRMPAPTQMMCLAVAEVRWTSRENGRIRTSECLRVQVCRSSPQKTAPFGLDFYRFSHGFPASVSKISKTI